MASLEPVDLDQFRPESIRWAQRLAEMPASEGWFLAGSAALSLYLGHRPIAALDLMSAQNRLTSPRRRDLLQQLQGHDSGIEVETARNGYLYCRSGSQSSPPGDHSADTSLKFYFYPYPVATESCSALGGLAVASAIDLGLMKLGAIISRGTARDFVDLFLLCRQLPLDELLAAAPKTFPHVRDFPLQALKGLTDLELARRDPRPKLAAHLDSIGWQEVEDWIAGPVRQIARKWIGLSETVRPEPSADDDPFQA